MSMMGIANMFQILIDCMPETLQRQMPIRLSQKQNVRLAGNICSIGNFTREQKVNVHFAILGNCYVEI